MKNAIRTIVLAASAAALAACGTAVTEPVAQPVPTATPVTQPAEDEPEPAPTPTPDPAPTAEELLGFLGPVGDSEGEVVVAFDPAEVLTGDEAVAYAREQGWIGPDETQVPNDSVIRNTEETWQELRLAEGATITVYRNPADPATEAEVSVAEFVSWRTDVGGQPLVFTASVAGGEITVLTMQYRP
ncbi:MAG: hypothetical protein R3343_11995 [Nitriliruptorales bacterium]|nr:hypothetical protein [Nitriliruptorales bacterium]